MTEAKKKSLSSEELEQVSGGRMEMLEDASLSGLKGGSDSLRPQVLTEASK